MSTVQSKSRFLSYIEFLKVTGRLGRIKYLILTSFWWLVLCLPLVAVGSAEYTSKYLHSHLLNMIPEQILTITLGIMALALFITCLLNFISLKMRRLNDFNFNGMWFLLSLIPILGIIWEIALLIIPGSKKDNKYGAPPIKPSFKEYLLSAFILLMGSAALLLVILLIVDGNKTIVTS